MFEFKVQTDDQQSEQLQEEAPAVSMDDVVSIGLKMYMERLRLRGASGVNPKCLLIYVCVYICI